MPDKVNSSQYQMNKDYSEWGGLRVLSTCCVIIYMYVGIGLVGQSNGRKIMLLKKGILYKKQWDILQKQWDILQKQWGIWYHDQCNLFFVNLLKYFSLQNNEIINNCCYFKFCINYLKITSLHSYFIKKGTDIT